MVKMDGGSEGSGIRRSGLGGWRATVVGLWTYSYYICTSIALIRFWTELTGGQTTPEVPHGS